jgi:isopenicillin N synthase-like dioxygenase
LLTFLPAATAKGLQVKDSQGNWHEVPFDHGMIAVNTGDTLTAITQGYLPATTHCVVNPDPEMAKISRFSMPLFLHPQDDVRLPDGRTAKDYLMQRLKLIGLA